MEKKELQVKEVITSTKNVFKLFIGDPKRLDGMNKKEVLFRVGQEDIWMPIQPQILKALIKRLYINIVLPFLK